MAVRMKFGTRVTLVFFLLFSVLAAYLIGTFYFRSVILQREALRDRLMQLADLGCSITGTELVERIPPVASSENNPEYKQLVKRLQHIMSVDTDIDDAYVLVPSERPGSMYFLANGNREDIVGCGEPFDVTPFPELIKAFDGPTADRKITHDKWGDWLSGYAPLKRPDGSAAGILGLDVSARTVARMRSHIRDSAVIAFFVVIVFSVLAGKIASWWLTRPIDKLVSGMDDIRGGDLDRRIELDGAEEIIILGDHFNKMAGELKANIEKITVMTAEKERLNRELEIAAELQKAMLPNYDLDIKDMDIAGLSLPAKEVGGDYFDYINRDGENIGFVVADATGKGLHSSIFMTNSKSIFKIITTEETSPGKVIERTNDLVIKEMGPSASSMFVTMFYGIYEKKKGVFRYSNAGHNPPVFLPGGSPVATMLNPHGCPVGVMEGQHYGESEINVSPGDIIVMYTDGVVEAVSPDGEMFGMQRLVDSIVASRELSSKEMVKKIKDEVFGFAGDRSQFDDLTLLVLMIR